MYREKSKLMDDGAINRALIRIAHEIIEHNADAEELLIVGIKRRGAPLGRQIADNIRRIATIRVEFSEMSIALYRDDLKEITEQAVVDQVEPICVKNKTIILVDDVIYTGRTVRAAIDCIVSMGRPACVQLAVLVDRGHRELPIRGDYVGKNVPTSKREMISVRVPEYDGVSAKEVVIMEDAQEDR